jgi:hypothetical protein
VIAEAAYIFSISALSLTLSGFAGLVAALRRGGELRPMDVFRLREIPEFGFATAILALLLVPLSATLGDAAAAVRVGGAIALAYIVAVAVLLAIRARALGIPGVRSLALAYVIPLDAAIVTSAAVCIASGSVAAYEWLLLFLLARPMVAFLLVLASFGDRQP